MAGDLGISETDFQLGHIWEGERRQLTVDLANTSNAALKLKVPATSCTCSQAELADRTLTAGQHTTLHIAITPLKLGVLNSSIIVQGEAKDSQPNEIKISATVDQAYLTNAMWVGGGKQIAGPPSELADTSVSQPRMDFFIDGLRQDDPLLKERDLSGNIRLQSTLFDVDRVTVQALQETGRMHLVIRLKSRDSLRQGMQYDQLKCSLGKQIEVSQSVAFRVIGDVWPEAGSIDFGRLNDGIAARSLVLHFKKGVLKWKDIHVIEVSPESLTDAVSLSDVTDEGNDIALRVAIDSSKMPAVVQGEDHFFHGNVVISDRANIQRPIKIMVYGMRP